MTPEEFLLAHGADRVDHPGGTLYDHLVRVADTLATWDADDDIRLAGLCHATYGTDGFDQALLPVEERRALRDVIGERAEALVYLYAGCDRRAVYPRLDGSPTAEFRDRFTGTALTVAGPDLRAFVEMTAANELDVLSRQPILLAQYGPSLLRLFDRCHELLSPPAWAACERLLTPAA
jgi:hypothetical protein